VRRFLGSPILSSVVQTLYAQTGGHPLFLANLVDYLVAQRQWSPQDSSITLNRALPDTVRRVIEHEIERLSAEEQRVLGIASAIGAEFSIPLLSAVVDAERVEVDRCCDGLVRRGRVLLAAGLEECSDGTVVGRYAFRHALYVEVLYQRLGGSGLIRLHRRIGECLEGLYDTPPPTVVAELALHFERGQDWVRAVRYLAQAAEHSARRAEALCEVPPGTMPEEYAVWNAINTSAILGQACLGLGDAARAIACFEAVVRTEQDETLPIRRNFFFPAYAGLSEAWLAQGELAQARGYAQRLHDFSAGAPERTYLALSNRLFAEIALREHAWAEAETHLTTALGLVEAAEVPLAAWRVYASAAKLYEQLRQPAKAAIYQRRSADVRLQLAASLDETDPLRRSIGGLG
jgi:tetratricopeptide (TPR) repeat protein